MAWIESHQELGAHPKTRKLAVLLGISRPAAVGHLQFLWWWAMDYAQDGELGRFEPLDIAIGGEWDGDADAFLDALIRAGFLDRDDAGVHIHDWDEYAGRLLEKRRQDAERKRTSRAVHRTSDGRDADVRETAHVTVPNHTEPNLTQPDQESDSAPARVKPPRAQRLPERFAPTDAQIAWAEADVGMSREQVGEETAKFRDHFRANGKAYADWDAAWRNWMRRSSEFRTAAGRSAGNGRASPAKRSNYDISAANIDAAGEPDNPFGDTGPIYETTARIHR